jgi:hypothetical protein
LKGHHHGWFNDGARADIADRIGAWDGCGDCEALYQDTVDRKKVEQNNALALQQAQAQAALQKQGNALQALQDETARKSLLARTIARQRAEYGGDGLSSGDGSASVVVQGLFDESDEQRKLREQSTALKDSAIDLTLSGKSQTNLLQQAQLQQQQAINRITDLFEN